MTSLGSFARTVVLAAAVAAGAWGGIALTAPSRLSAALGMDDPTVLHVGTAFGIAALLLVTAIVLRPARELKYHFVHHHDPEAVRRPRPSGNAMKVSRKTRAKVRASSAANARRDGKGKSTGKSSIRGKPRR